MPRVLIIVITYKNNVEDVRESPAFKLIELLEQRGAKTEFYDPHVERIPNTREHPKLAARTSIKWEEAALRGYDAVLITTDHDDVDYQALAIIDTRNACSRAGTPGDNVVKA